MLRRALPILLALTAALLVAGCGSKSSGTGLGDALDYMPKDAPLVIALSTDIDGDQYQQLDKLVGKFPFGGQIKQTIKDRLAKSAGTDWDKIKPLLGHDFVVALTSTQGLRAGGSQPFVVAWKVNGGDVKKKLIPSSSTKVSSVDGTDVYRSTSGDNYGAVKDDTLIVSRDQTEVEAALKRAGDGDHMTEDDFNAALGDLDKNALVRSVGDFQRLLGNSAGVAVAKKVKWIAALRTFGQTLSVKEDGVEAGFDVKTEGDLQDADLPLASGSETAPVVRRAGEVGIGLRNPSQLFTFGQAVAQVTDSTGFSKFEAAKTKLGKQLGVDVDRDLAGQLTGNSALSIGLDGQFAVRADLRDPAAAEATLKKVAPRLEKLAKGKSVGLAVPKNGKGFYALAQANGKKLVFGVVGKTFVAATDAARAAQFAGQSPSVVPNAKGSFVVASDARALANAIAQRQGQGTAAQFVTGALGDLIGSVETETDGLKGTLKLFVK